MDVYSRVTNGAESLSEVVDRFFPWCAEWKPQLKELFRGYTARKHKQNVLDYDDLLIYWEQLVADERIGDLAGGRFDHVLVDEYQDTNRIQANILGGMRRQNHNIMAVGDDAQSIYSFRAASVRNMFDFPQQFPGTRIVTLEQNYRSVMSILQTTNRVIAAARQRYTKDLWSSREQGQRPRLITCWDEAQQDQYVVERVLEHYEQGIPLRRQAVLFRASHLSDSLEIELTRRNIPYHKYGGLRFLEAAHVKDLLAFLKIVENPRDDLAWFRVLQLMDGIGPAAASAALAHLGGPSRDPKLLATFQPPAAAAKQWPEFVSLVQDLVAAGRAGPAPQIERIRKFYDPILSRIYENAKVRARDIENLEQIATGYRSRLSFLTDLQLDPPVSTSDLAGPPHRDEDWLVLSTIHSAKGCEWDSVYLIHAADGCLPSDMATGNDDEVEEELRLAYVALTRARDFLYVLWPMKYYHRWSRYTDRHSYAQLSRFFTEDVRSTMDLVELDQPHVHDVASDAHSGMDIRSRLSRKWDD
jgi:DNA helicase II / ATP-dependent DNA helicase PcrA